MLRSIRKNIRNKDYKVLLENFISLSFIKVFGLLIPVLVIPHLLSTIGLEKYGMLILATSLINYFTALTDYSFAITATRDVALFKESKIKLGIVYSNVVSIKTIFLIFSILILLVLIYTIPIFKTNYLIFLLTIPMLIGNAIFPEWFFLGIEKMKYISIINISTKILFTIGVFIFINDKKDYWIYPVLQSLGFIVSGIIAQFILIRKYKLRLRFVKIRTIKYNIRKNTPIFINQIMPTLYNNTSSFLLGLISGTFYLGIYDAIKKIIDLFSMIISIISRVFYPFLIRKNKSFKQFEKMMIFIGLILSLTPIVLNQVIFNILKINYEYSFYVLTFLSISLFGMTLYSIYGLNFLIIKRKDKIVMKNTITGSIIGFVSAIPLIYFFGIIGASLNLAFTRLYIGIKLMLIKKRYVTENIL